VLQLSAGTDGDRPVTAQSIPAGFAFKVITSMRMPDHSTIAEFRRRHEADIAELFDGVLGLCREAGLVSVGVITIDGTKIKANASMDQNRSYRKLSPRSCAKLRRPVVGRTSSTDPIAVMSCPSSCARRMDDVPHWRKQSDGWQSERDG